MIIEFIGASGSGKSTLAGELATRRAAGGMSLAWDLVLDRPGLRRITHPTARNLAAEVTISPWLLRAWPQYREFLGYARQLLGENARTTFERLNYQRSILRKVGMHELALRRGGRHLVIADEGTVLTSYYLFVYARSPFRTDEVDRFAALVPLPDWIVYVKAPLQSLVERATNRVDRRRELAPAGQAELEHWIGRAVEVFDYLATTPPIRDRMLTVDNVDGPAADREALVDRIQAWTTGEAPGRARHPVQPPHPSVS
ncbi:MAG TPA: hypothetical protein VLA54_14825 [Acidimicrobiia bacterium]|nr:hypothetical protein [Acidimicrobiia bacterium]